MIDKIVFPSSLEIDEEVIQHYEENPDELDLMINKEYFNVVYLSAVFLLGLVITVSSRLISYFFGSYIGEFLDSIVLDILSELGIAIFGGAVVAYIIEFLNKRQFQENLKFRRKVKSILDQRKADNASSK